MPGASFLRPAFRRPDEGLGRPRLWGAVVALAIGLGAGCASDEAAGPEVVLEEPTAREAYASPRFEDLPEAELPEGDVELRHRGPAPDGTSYRLLAEWSGEQEMLRGGKRRGREPRRESKQIELEFRELPVEAPDEVDGAYVLVLDGLHFQLLQREPAARREIEIYDDRLRILDGKETVLDLRGAQPRERLTPRMLLGKVFAVVAHDRFGNPLRILPRGAIEARESLAGLPLREVIGYSRLALPDRSVGPGTSWRAERFPASPVGQLGLSVEVEHTLVGFQRIGGAPVAWLRLQASREAEDVPSASGFRFDRVRASLQGHAWVDLETSRVRRLVLEDDLRAAYTRSDQERSITHRLRYKGRLLLERRDPTLRPQRWADGTERFGKREG